MLVSGELDPVAERGKHDSAAIHWAAGSGHTAIVCCLLDFKPSSGGEDSCSEGDGDGAHGGPSVLLDQRDKRSGRTAVHWAARNGHTALLEMLADRYKGAVDLDVATFDGTTPFQLAVWAGHKEVCEMLLRRGVCTPGHVNSYGCNALHFACIAGREDMCRWLHGDACNVSAWVVQRQGHTALHKAAWAGSHAICKWLQEEVGLDRECVQQDVKGHTAADIARIAGHAGLAKALVSRGGGGGGCAED
jgi:ankyrin repeat protein